MTRSGPLLYRCSPTILWLKDADQTLVIDTNGGKSWSMCGAEAAIWDLLVLNYTAQRIAGILPLVLGQTSEEAWRMLRAVVQGWEQAGILLPVAGEGHG